MKARALYENISDDAEELSFRKNDVMEVLEEDYDGMEGWWLCRLGGKTGIAPGNRLILITDPDKDYERPKSGTSDRKSRTDDYDTPASKNQYNGPIIDRASSNSRKSRSSDGSISKVFIAFKKAHIDLEIPNEQLIKMIDRWVSCQNSRNVQTVIKTMCTNHWKNMQSYVAESSKLVAYFAQGANPNMHNIKQSSKNLEDLLGIISKGCLEQDVYIETLNRLKIITNSLAEDMEIVKNLYEKLEEESLTKDNSNAKYPFVASFSGMDYDMPKNLSNLNKTNLQNTKFAHQSFHNGRIGDSDYDRPKSIENFSRKSSEVFNCDYDMPKKSMEALNKSLSPKIQGEDSLDYDIPTKPSVSSFLSNTNPITPRVRSDFINNGDYDVPTVDETRKSMDHLDSIKNQSKMKAFNPLPKKSLDMSDYDHPSVSDSNINDANKFHKTKKNILPNNNLLKMNSQPQTKPKPTPKPSFDENEVKLLKYYKPKIIENLDIITQKMKSINNEVSTGTFDHQSFTTHLKQFVICLYKMVYIIDFNTKRLPKHVYLCRDLNLLCKKNIECVHSIASSSEYSNDSGNVSSIKTNIQEALDRMKDFLHNIAETIKNLEI